MAEILPRSITQQERDRIARASLGQAATIRDDLERRSQPGHFLSRRQRGILTLANRRIEEIRSSGAAPRAASTAASRSSGS